MKLIDADAIVTVQMFDVEHEEYTSTKMTVGECLDNFTDEGCPPTVQLTVKPNVQPKRGRWIGSHCSICDWYVYKGDQDEYCPHCGAKMEGGEWDETD